MLSKMAFHPSKITSLVQKFFPNFNFSPNFAQLMNGIQFANTQKFIDF